jgi:soluble lytic murein transglycosylase-like protein
VPSFVPAAYQAPIARAASRWNVSATLLAAQLHAESGFNPLAVSPAGARGIAQFMPGTARAYRLPDPFEPAAAIQAQARLMRDLLRGFGTVPLVLAAYNAGPSAVASCGCIPPYAETRAYVAQVLALMGQAGEMVPGAGGLEVRLVS